jgi:hypothetical protein
MWLTGPPGVPPLGPPRGLVAKLRAIGEVLARQADAVGGQLAVDPLALLGERAAIGGLERHGDVSCGGASRLFRARDGWMALTLARPDDVDLVPAWLQAGAPENDVWTTVVQEAAIAPSAELLDRARLLGLPAAVLPPAPRAVPAAPAPLLSLPLEARPIDGPTAAPAPRLADLLVVDLSSLWAGPLCGALLACAGARVVKVESTHRPDGARLGPEAFFDLLNGAKRSVALDLGTPEGAVVLRVLLARADVVIEASRPRALAHMGIEADVLVAAGGPRVWVSITGHGRAAPHSGWVGFGDDAAVAGGLVSWFGEQPCFCADAVADPTSGAVAAAAVLDALATGGRWVLDVAMAGVAAHLAGPTLPAGDPPPTAVPPCARTAPGRAPRLGEHTDAVLAELEISR